MHRPSSPFCRLSRTTPSWAPGAQVGKAPTHPSFPAKYQNLSRGPDGFPAPRRWENRAPSEYLLQALSMAGQLALGCCLQTPGPGPKGTPVSPGHTLLPPISTNPRMPPIPEAPRVLVEEIALLRVNRGQKSRTLRWAPRPIRTPTSHHGCRRSFGQGPEQSRPGSPAPQKGTWPDRRAQVPSSAPAAEAVGHRLV